MAQSRPMSTPLPPSTELVPAKDGSGVGADELLSVDDGLRFREITGSLMYLVACTRVDLAVAVNQLARNMAKPSKAHMTAAKHVLRYLRGTASLALRYGNPSAANVNTVVGYADATWGNIPGSSRSVSGNVFLLNGAAVSWKCKVQSCVALSTAEAEFFSLCEATREAVYLRNLMEEIGLPQTSATRILEDNQPCIHLVHNPVTVSRSKHVAIRFNFVRERLELGQIDVVYCPTGDMVADALTKALPRPQHVKHRETLFGWLE